jgi:enoyl-CoA hydratase
VTEPAPPCDNGAVHPPERTMTTHETLLIEDHGAVRLIRLNRPEALNALNAQVLADLLDAFAAFDTDPALGCAVLTGSDKAFAAGADVKEMQPMGFAAMYSRNMFAGWEEVTRTRKPWIAAVAGFALGGGCEVAMMADFILAADTAKFGQPEIRLGITPGMGGSQRLTRAVGKAKAMEMCLTGRMMDAAEAERAGLVARVVPADQLIAEAMKAAKTIATKSLPVVMMTKEAVERADETSLAEGLRFERRLFHALFALNDQKEGMQAFIDKRKPDFTNS